MTDQERAVMQQALEALDVFANAIRVWPEETWAPHEFAAMDKGEAAIAALRAALEEQEQEPVELTIERLRDALVASRIIPPASVEDPDGYDGGVTLFRIEALHRRIT